MVIDNNSIKKNLIKINKVYKINRMYKDINHNLGYHSIMIRRDSLYLSIVKI